MTTSSTIKVFPGRGETNDMSKRSKYATRPSDPAEAKRRRMLELEAAARAEVAKAEREKDPRNWGIAPELALLETANDLDLRPDITGRIVRAKRWDIFSLLRSTKIGPNRTDTVLNGDHIIAVDRLQRDIAIRHMTAGASGNGRASDTPEDFPLARILATERLLNVVETRDKPLGVLIQMARQDKAGATLAKLLVDLSTPTITRGERVNWRSVVETVTGEHRKALQAGKVREACDALVNAYGGVDRAPRAKAA